MEMETSSEPMDPLTPSVAALAVQPEGGSRTSGRSPGGCPLRNVTLSSLDLGSCLCPQSIFLKKFKGSKDPGK